MRVLVVWEPILATDWRAPSKAVLARIPDRRARQFWDPNHLVAEQLVRIQKRGQLEPDCCVRGGFHWDEACPVRTALALARPTTGGVLERTSPSDYCFTRQSLERAALKHMECCVDLQKSEVRQLVADLQSMCGNKSKKYLLGTGDSR